LSRRVFEIDLVINGMRITSVEIDPHYELRHSKSVSDSVILELVKTLDQTRFEPVEIDLPYSYFVTDRISFEGKFFKLIWLLENQKTYIGVVNAYRR
jgi:hypothetical protein